MEIYELTFSLKNRCFDLIFLNKLVNLLFIMGSIEPKIDFKIFIVFFLFLLQTIFLYFCVVYVLNERKRLKNKNLSMQKPPSIILFKNSSFPFNLSFNPAFLCKAKIRIKKKKLIYMHNSWIFQDLHKIVYT